MKTFVKEITTELDASWGHGTPIITFLRHSPDSGELVEHTYPVDTNRRANRIDGIVSFGHGNDLVKSPTVYTWKDRIRVSYRRKG